MNTPASDAPAAAPRTTPKPLIGVTMGEPAGIGAEVIVKALADPQIRELGRFIVYGVDEILTAAGEAAGIRPYWFTLKQDDPHRVDSGVVVVDIPQYSAGYWLNARPTALGGEASLRFLDAAIDAAKKSAIQAIVTAPIHKVSWKMAGCNYPGHTEKLADAFNVKRVTMTFIGGGMIIALASAHVGLFELRNHFTIGLVFQPIDLLNDMLRDWYGLETPRIAVAGLNPHAGEEGRFGDEEQRVIEPAMQMARNAGIDVEGPFPADTLFTPASRSRYDGLVAMYHDQGLIPVKMIAFDSAVNVTLGLPTIRTSVDHGTAFDIAGSNQADPGSMKEALRLACRFASTPPLSRPAASLVPVPEW
jgi:4-phospho-D-threonate 3-dehydrogenase / 4-phospho-D-erythronate 3-dehydrogenase